MIQLVIYDKKKNKTVMENYNNKDKAEERLNEIGPKLKTNETPNPKKRYFLEGGSADSKSEETLLKPFLFPERGE